ncbi:G-protein coupled receptor Mth-like [Neocloeon triangulifer]|uniref:G-protein coupled receptor Mth-like n=1 Tax=Neocloeon triangulifer TaxID=2078957 RepID=UPI00286F2EE2|nr:G-protein coupled receptor Mth-like [Neocloeon triangulifer]
MQIKALLMLSAITLAVGAKLILQKCCPQRLAYNFTSGKCEAVISNQIIAWIPDQFETIFSDNQILVPSLEEFDFNYGPCPEILQDVARPVKIDRSTNIKLSKSSIVVSNQTYQQWCLDAVLGQSSRQWVLLSCPCLHENCITRCCPHGKRLHIERASGKSFHEICQDEDSSWTPWTAKDLRIKRNFLKPEIFLHLSLRQYMENCFLSIRKDYAKARRPEIITNFEINEFGVLKSRRSTANRWSYCLAEATVRGELRTVAMHCDRTEYNRISNNDAIAISFFAGVGAFFTLITLIVHLIVKDLRQDISGLIIIAHCICLFSAYLSMAFRPLARSQDTNVCIISGILSHFFFVSSFFWLNVRAIIIYCTFRSLDSMLSKLSLRKSSFPLYALYALGVPALISAFMAWAQFADSTSLPSWVVWPAFDDASCWFRSSFSRGLYFSLPMGIALLINIFLFIKTVIQIELFRRENQKVLNRSEDTIKETNLKFRSEKFKLFATFSILLCVTYIPECISWFYNDFSFYYFISIFVITLRAILLFVIFCFQEKVWISLKRQHPWLEKLSSRCCRKKSLSDKSQISEMENKKSSAESTDL